MHTFDQLFLSIVPEIISVQSIELFNTFDLFGSLRVLKTYLLRNDSSRQRKQGGYFENRGYSCKSNYKVEVLLKACDVLLLRSFCIGTFMESWLKEVVFETNVQIIMSPKIPISRKKSNLTFKPHILSCLRIIWYHSIHFVMYSNIMLMNILYFLPDYTCKRGSWLSLL